MKVLNALFITLALSLMITPPANANLIINGSFETPDIAPGQPGPVGGWAVFYQPILGWTPIAGMGFEIQDHVIGIWDAYQGNQLAEMDADTNGGMFQTVSTTLGQEYILSFAYSPRPDAGPETNIINFYFDGALIESITGSGVGKTNTSWSLYSYTFTAMGSSSTIMFMAGGISDGLGGFIDDVQFSAVPEPSTLLLLGSGLVGLVRFGRRMKI